MLSSQIIPPSPSPTESKSCSLHLCLFCCLIYRVIVTIFLNSIYMCYYTILVFFFLTYFTLYNRLLGIHTEGTRIERDTCTPMFIEALFTTARAWNQPRYPSSDEWIRKLWYIYTAEYYSAIEKNAFESVLMKWMKLEPIIQSKVIQKEKHQYSILMHIRLWRWPYMRDSKRNTDVKNRLLDSVGEGKGEMIWEDSIETCILSYVK